MPRLALTDVSVRSLKAETRTDFGDTKLPSFGIRVGPRSKTFVAKVGNRRLTIGSYPGVSLQDARKRAMELKVAPPSSQSETTFMEAYRAFETIRCATVRENTAHGYLAIMNRCFVGSFKSKRLSEITHKNVLAITDKMAKRPGAQSHALATARTFWKFCIRRRYVSSSPVEGVQLPKSTSRDRVLTDHELKCIWKACELTAEREVDTPSKPDGMGVTLVERSAVRAISPVLCSKHMCLLHNTA